jgi:hypothetical protein
MICTHCDMMYIIGSLGGHAAPASAASHGHDSHHGEHHDEHHGDGHGHGYGTVCCSSHPTIGDKPWIVATSIANNVYREK